MVISVTFFPVEVVGKMDKTSPQQKVSQHISALEESFMNNISLVPKLYLISNWNMLSLEVTGSILSIIHCNTVLYTFALYLMLSVVRWISTLSARTGSGKPGKLANFGMEYSRTSVFFLESQGRVG